MRWTCTSAKRLVTEDTVNAVGFSFFGEQGPWYTVGMEDGGHDRAAVQPVLI
jgi:hypothetical protein